MTEQEFATNISKKKGKRHTKTNSTRIEKVYDSIPYRTWKTQGYKKPNRRLFAAILKEFGKVSIDFWLHGYDLIFPCQLGRLCLIDISKNITIDNKGKATSNMKTDWKTTLKLWNEDEEAYNKKIIIQYDRDKITSFSYNKGAAVYKNKQFYHVFIKRSLLTSILT